MKYILTIFFMAIINCTYSHDSLIICGKIASSHPFELKIYSPINNYYNASFFEPKGDKPLFISSDSFYQKIPLRNFSCLYIYITNQKIWIDRANFLGAPRDSIHIKIDLREKGPNWIRFTGSNAPGNQLFSEMTHDPINIYLPIIELLKNISPDYSALIEDVEEIIDNRLKNFRELYKKEDISSEYYTAIVRTFRLRLNNEVTRKFIRPYGNVEKIPEEIRDSVIQYFFNQLNPLDSNLTSLYLPQLYIEDYYNYNTYKKEKFNSAFEINRRDTIITFKNSTYEIDRLLSHLLYIPDREQQENLWAFNLGNILRLSKGHFKDSSIIDQFSQLFPNSCYSALLMDIFQKNAEESVTITRRKVLSPIIILDSNANTLDLYNFLKIHFNKKPVYVDIWATWCGPCLEEFSFNGAIDSFLFKNKIERLYISIDKSNNMNNWLKVINEQKLGGKHILANKIMLQKLTQQIGLDPEKPFAIPRYLIIDSNGFIVEPNALRPSDGVYLFKQLSNKLALLDPFGLKD